MSRYGYFPTESDLALKGAAQAALHERAAAAARNAFGKEVFVRAVVEVSNFCRENCRYCGMRRDNRTLARYRARHDLLAELLIRHRPASVTDVNIQAGEDPIAVREVVLPLIRALRRETPLGISVCLGNLTPALYGELQSAGASIYIMKFECADPLNYEQLEAPGTLDERVRHIRILAASGWKVSSGFIAGLPGEGPQNLLVNLRLADALPLDGCSVSPFIPGEDTPCASSPAAGANWTLNSMAALRLMRPDWVIPAVSALNLAEKDGYRRGLRAGANLVTINLTPTTLRENYVIYKRDRFIMTEDRVLTAIAAEGLTPSRRGLAQHYRNGAALPVPENNGRDILSFGMASRVLLINANRCSVPDPVFPLGLSYVNAALRRAGHETRLLDLLAEPQPVEEVLRHYQPNFVGISLRNVDNVLIRKQETYFEGLLTLSDDVRRAHPCTVVIGGSGFSIYPEELFELSRADFGIQGEGEATFVALLAALQEGGDFAAIPGLVYRRNGQIMANAPRPNASEPELETADRPAAVAHYYLSNSGMLNVQTQRGCGHSCAYCAYPLIEGRTHRRRHPKAVANEFERLQALGAKYAFVVDSVFNSSEGHVNEICDAILRRGIKLSWGCFLRPQSLTPEMMRLMARAGLTHIEFGSDSFCDTVLEQYDKRFTFDDIARSSELARAAGIEHCHYLICGGPGETAETLETGFQNSRHLAGSAILAVVGMRIYPGTPLVRRAVRDGLLPAEADLLAPAYYLAPGLDEAKVFARLRDFARRASNWIVGDPPPDFANLVTRLRRRGIVGPLWSYFAMLQRIMPQGAAELTRAVPTT